jgi:predicted polyphosphate/ATP-dependent NAD kinase
MRIGLIVNPIAGIGGRVGLKGSDGAEIQQLALSRGGVPQAHLRAEAALEVLTPWQDALELVTLQARWQDRRARICSQVIGRSGRSDQCSRHPRFAQACPTSR